jgi:hypothetical protein
MVKQLVNMSSSFIQGLTQAREFAGCHEESVSELGLSLALAEDTGELSLDLPQLSTMDAEFHVLFIEKCSRNL